MTITLQNFQQAPSLFRDSVGLPSTIPGYSPFLLVEFRARICYMVKIA